MARRYTRVITTPAAARSPRDWNRPFVSLLSDWGVRDPSPAICRGVVLGIAPEALIVDITHEVAKYNIRHGALMLWCALPFLPIGAHVAVVDPGVGTARRALALETARGDYLIGPDNGLLLPGAQRLGGVTRAHLIENAQYLLPAQSATFHGRDVFSPAAAHLAIGVPLETIGRPLGLDTLIAPDWPAPTVDAGRIATSVLYVDTFGNVKLTALAADMHAAFEELSTGELLPLRVGASDHPTTVLWAHTFGDTAPGELLLYEDSYGRLCLARNQGSAAEALGLSDGVSITIGEGEPAPAEPATQAQAAG